MIDKPTDIVVIFLVIGLVVLMFGAVMTDLDTSTLSQDTPSTIYANFETYTDNDSYFKGTSDAVSEGLSAQSTPSDSDSFLFSMSTGVLKLGKTWSAVDHAASDFSTELMIPGYIIALVTGAVLACMGLVIWMWWRGKQ